MLLEEKKTGNSVCESERVSVIVPVYNVKEYLREALDSLLTQTYRNLEILFVDDGSTDGSGEICDEYARKDERIQVIHQENRGLSGARNAALELMTGELVMFLDPDDAYHPEMIRKMVETLHREQTDMVLCKYSVRRTKQRMNPYEPGMKICPSAPEGKYDRVCALQALADGLLNFAVWNRIYRRELWDGIRFPQGHVYEDVVAAYRILNCITSIYVLDEELYFQRIHSGTITTVYSEDNIRDRILAFTMQETYIRDHIQGVFTEEQIFRMNRQKMNILIDMYSGFAPTEVSGREFARTLRQQIIRDGESFNIQKCSFRTRFFYLLLKDSPWLLKAIYPCYRLLKTKI